MLKSARCLHNAFILVYLCNSIRYRCLPKMIQNTLERFVTDNQSTYQLAINFLSIISNTKWNNVINKPFLVNHGWWTGLTWDRYFTVQQVQLFFMTIFVCLFLFCFHVSYYLFFYTTVTIGLKRKHRKKIILERYLFIR